MFSILQLLQLTKGSTSHESELISNYFETASDGKSPYAFLTQNNLNELFSKTDNQYSTIFDSASNQLLVEIYNQSKKLLSGVLDSIIHFENTFNTNQLESDNFKFFITSSAYMSLNQNLEHLKQYIDSKMSLEDVKVKSDLLCNYCYTSIKENYFRCRKIL